MDTIYLNVPYAEKDLAKRNGARWDPNKRQWYVSSKENLENCLKWLPDSPIRQEIRLCVDNQICTT